VSPPKSKRKKKGASAPVLAAEAPVAKKYEAANAPTTDTKAAARPLPRWPTPSNPVRQGGRGEDDRGRAAAR
jgi:hypothetical protein